MIETRCDPSVIDCYAVMGNPIAHSKSPQIHRLFAEQTGQELCYEALLIEPDSFTRAVNAFKAMGGKGLNITVPFKQEAWQLADRKAVRAERAGAVNTLIFHNDGTLVGDNTDGIGLVRDLTRNLGIIVQGKRVLMLGAGGAARGVLAPLLEQQPISLHIANRTVDRAIELATAFADLGDISSSGLDDIPPAHYDLIVNATAAGLENTAPDLPPGTISPDSYCYDMMYGSEPTAFMRYANAQGSPCAYDGLGMLVEQAAESFRLWRDVKPQTGPVIEQLRNV